MFKKLILLCLALSLLVTSSVPALAEQPPSYYTAHSVDELIQWVNTAEAEESEAWGSWYPFLRAAREFDQILTVQSTSNEYSLKEIMVQSNQDNMQYFFEKGNDRFLVYIELPGTEDNPKPSFAERMAKINRELSLEYEQVQYTAASITLNGTETPLYYCNGGEYQKKGSDEPELFAPTAYYDWQGYTVMIRGIGDLYGSEWDHAYFNLFKFDLHTLDFYPQRTDPYATADTSWYNEEDDSFVIRTADQLAGLAHLVNSGTDFSGKTIKLENSIDLSDYAEDWNDGKGWTPIGQADAIFKGHFDGNNKTISGLYINDSKLDYAGLFGCIDSGSVKNLGLVNVVVKGQNHVGGIAGKLYTDGWSSETHGYNDCAMIKNCFVTGTVEGVASVGGIAGSISCSYTNDCYSSAAVTGKSSVGGIVGSAGLCGVENCYSTGSVSGDKNVGGIAGNFTRGTLFTSYATGQISGSDCVGGIVGKNNFLNIVRECVALNDSVSGTTNVGRIAGYNEEDSQLQTNYALDCMAIFEGDNQKETLLNTHDQVDGKDICKEDSLKAAFWLDTMEYRPNVFAIADGTYPALSKILEIDIDFYRVSFVDWDGSELKNILVPHGSATEAPASPVREGYVFAGWDQAFDNVTEDLAVTATYRWVNPFADMTENDWFYDEVQYVYEKDLMNGVSDNRFAPEDDVSRAMAATVLYRLAEHPVPETAPGFTDVEAKKWYSDGIYWAASEGIAEGYGNSKFGTNDPVTREQLVTMFWRAQGKPAADPEALSAFSDADQISSWAKKAFAWAVSTGLIQGKPGGLLDPTGTTSRAQLATILMRTNEAN